MSQRLRAAARWAGVALACASFIVSSGCSTVGVALTPETPTPVVGQENSLVLLVIETSKGPIGLMKAKQILPIVEYLDILSNSSSGSKAYPIPHSVIFHRDNAGIHLISLLLSPGEYEVARISGRGVNPKWLSKQRGSGFWAGYQGEYNWPLGLSFSVSPGRVLYVGRIKAHMRRRRSKEERHAGPLAPVIPQRVSGFYPSTFDVMISDEFDADMALFWSAFPDLKKHGIEKSLLVPAAAQGTPTDQGARGQVSTINN